jgi:hypothetical protein
VRGTKPGSRREGSGKQCVDPDAGGSVCIKHLVPRHVLRRLPSKTCQWIIRARDAVKMSHNCCTIPHWSIARPCLHVFFSSSKNTIYILAVSCITHSNGKSIAEVYTQLTRLCRLYNWRIGDRLCGWLLRSVHAQTVFSVLILRLPTSDGDILQDYITSALFPPTFRGCFHVFSH